MSRANIFVVAASVLWLIGSVCLLAHKSYLLIFILPLDLLFLCAILVAAICVFKRWRDRRWRAAVPLAVCLIAFVLSHESVEPVRNLLFAWSLPSYEAVVRQVEAGTIPVSYGLQELPQAESEARLAYSVDAEKCPNGVVMIAFTTDYAQPPFFPLPESYAGYLYSSSGKIEPGSKLDTIWPTREKVRKGWFYVSD